MNPIVGLSLGRIAIGVGALLSPTTSAKLFMLDADRNAQLSYPMRLFASREIALGAVTLAAPSALRTPLLAAGVAIDASDAAAGLLATKSGEVGTGTGAWLTAPALGAVAAGIAGIVLSRRGS